MSKKQSGKPGQKPARPSAAPQRKATAAVSVKAAPVKAVKAAPKSSATKPSNSLSKPVVSPKSAAKSAKASATVAMTPPAARTIAVAKPEQTKKGQGGSSKMAPRAKVSEIVLPAGYRPSEDEPFMNEMHRAYFRKRLIEWKDEILRQTRETLAILHEDSTQHADLADRATSETDRATELRTRDRQRKLIAKIDAALARIEDGSYGYCEDTGEPIGLKRLDARPIATLSLEAQERHERREKVYREE